MPIHIASTSWRVLELVCELFLVTLKCSLSWFCLWIKGCTRRISYLRLSTGVFPARRHRCRSSSKLSNVIGPSFCRPAGVGQLVSASWCRPLYSSRIRRTGQSVNSLGLTLQGLATAWCRWVVVIGCRVGGSQPKPHKTERGIPQRVSR